MFNTNRHRMIVQSFVISKPEQVYHFQMRLPRNTKQVVAIDYDVFVKENRRKEVLRPIAVAVPKETTNPQVGSVSETGNPKETNPNGTTELPLSNSIEFKWTSKINPTIGKLKLQSLETANIFYAEWIKALMWNIGFTANGIFPNQPYSLLQKQKPLHVEVSPQTTMLNGLYEDVILKSITTQLSYQVKVFVWLEMNENAKGVEFEFLKPKIHD